MKHREKERERERVMYGKKEMYVSAIRKILSTKITTNAIMLSIYCRSIVARCFIIL